MSDSTEQPVYWFMLLERARAASNQPLVSKALAELRRLGVDVRLREQPAQETHRP